MLIFIPGKGADREIGSGTDIVATDEIEIKRETKKNKKKEPRKGRKKMTKSRNQPPDLQEGKLILNRFSVLLFVADFI